jgi:hypothetical protein
MGTFSERLAEIAALLRAQGVKGVPHGPGMARTIQDLQLRVAALELEVEQRTDDVFEAIDRLERIVCPKAESTREKIAARPPLPTLQAQAPQGPQPVGGPSIMPNQGLLQQFAGGPQPAAVAAPIVNGAIVAPNQIPSPPPAQAQLAAPGQRIGPSGRPMIPVGSPLQQQGAAQVAPRFNMGPLPPGVPAGVLAQATGAPQPAKTIETTAETAPEKGPAGA